MTENLYAILGVDEKAEVEVISAAHKALAKKYHPDTFTGDKKFAEEKLKKINAAFDILSDPKKRSQYDNELKNNTASENFDDDEGFEGDEFGESVLQEDWAVVVEVYPEAEFVRKRLYTYSPKLSFTFQILILSSKSAAHSAKIGEGLRREFLTKFFGTNKELQEFVECLLSSGKRQVAAEINKKIAILGSDASARVLADVKKKYSAELKDIKFSPPESFQQAERKRKDGEKRAAGEQSKKDAYEARNATKRKSAFSSDKPKAKPMGAGFFIMVILLVLVLLSIIGVTL